MASDLLNIRGMKRALTLVLFLVMLIGFVNVGWSSDSATSTETAQLSGSHQTQQAKHVPDIIRGMTKVAKSTRYQLSDRLNVSIRPSNSRLAVMSYSF